MKTKKKVFLPFLAVIATVCLSIGVSGILPVAATATEVNKDTFAGYFTAVGDDGLDAYVNDISYGTFTNTNFSGGGVMVETRNKTAELVSNTENDNTTNPMLIDFPSVKYSTGVKFDGVVDLSNNTADDSTLIELAFPGTNDNWQNRGFKVVIEDAANPDKYITLYIWSAYGNTDTTGGSVIGAAVASWETTHPNSIKDAGFDTDNYNSTEIFSRVGEDLNDGASNTAAGKPTDGCFLNTQEYGHAKTSINFSRTSTYSVKVQFNNTNGNLAVNGVHIRNFSKFSALLPADNSGATVTRYGSNVFDRFSHNKVKLSVGIVRTTRRSTDEFTKFCIMNIDGNDLTADGSDNISYDGLDLTAPASVNKNAVVANFTAVGDTYQSVDYSSYVNDISYGTFSADKFSGGGVMVETRNKTSELKEVTDNSNDTNPILINFPAGKYATGVRYEGVIDVSDNTAYDTLVEVAFPGENDNFQVRGFKVVIEDASNPNKYITLFIWNAYGNTDAIDTNKSSILASAGATWESTDPNIIGNTGFDTDDYNNDGTEGDGYYVPVGDHNNTGDSNGKEICWLNAGGPHGHRVTSIKFSKKSDNTVKVQFDNATGTILVNGVRVRKFSAYSNDGEHYFPGFLNDEVKVSVGVVRSVRRSTDEFTRFCVMSIDGISLKADGSDDIHYYGLNFNLSLTDDTTGTVKSVAYGTVCNVGDLFTDGEKQAVGYMVGEDLHDISELSAVTMDGNKSYDIVYAHFWASNGASVRVAGKTGLRFKGWLKGKNANVDETVNIVSEFGMLIAPTDYIADKDFTIEDYAAGKLEIAQATNSGKDSDNDTYFYVTIVNLQEKNIAKAFSARLYVKVDYYDASSAYFYSDYSVENNSRSAYGVAQAAYADPNTTAEEKTFLDDNYLSKVVELSGSGSANATGSASYSVDSVSYSGDGTIMYLTVSGANGLRGVSWDGSAIAAGQGHVPDDTNLAMYEQDGKLQIALEIKHKEVSEQSQFVISGGNTAYSILIPENASKVETFAAQELQEILYDGYGVELPITSAYDENNSKYISLGDTEFRKAAKVSLYNYTKKQGGFKIKSYRDGVVIYSEDDYALYYGIYRFLEENFGYKYYAYDYQKINGGSTQTLKYFDYEDYPDIKYRSLLSETTRNAYHIGDVSDSSIPLENNALYINTHLYTTSSHYNRNNSTTSAVYGSGRYGAQIPPFTWQLDDQSLLTYFLPYDNSWDYYSTGLTYGQTHGDWYVKDGGAVKQICFSKAYNNDNGMYDIILNKLKAVIADSHNSGCPFFEIGIGDNWNYCTCSACSSYGNGKSDVYLRFVNKLAGDIKTWQETECPDREIYLMAYAYMAYTLAPTVETAADNVIIRICPYTAYYDKAYNSTSNVNSSGTMLNGTNWKSIFDGWSVKATNLGVWDYRSDFTDYLEPFPFWKQLENNIRYFKSLGVMEVMAQGYGSWYSNVLNPFEEMDNFVRSRMLWNASLSYTELKDEFIDAYYGAAATYVKNYISAIDTAFGSENFRIGKNDITKSKYSSGWVSTVKGYFDSAYAAVGDDAAKKRRLDYLSLFYRYLQIKFGYSGADKTTFKSMCASLGIVYAENGVNIAEM